MLCYGSRASLASALCRSGYRISRAYGRGPWTPRARYCFSQKTTLRSMDLTNSSSHRHVMIIVWIFIVINAVFLFSVSLLPFIDLPNHLAEATIFKYHGTPGNRLSQFYT